MEKGMIGTNIVTQIGMVVRDIEATTKAFAEFFGVPVPPIFTTPSFEQSQAQYNGEPCYGLAKQSFFHVGDHLDIELLQPDEKPSVWRDFLLEKGEGVHHIAFVIDGMKEKLAVMEANGMPLMQKGEYTGGRYAYCDATEQLKVILELLENDKK